MKLTCLDNNPLCADCILLKTILSEKEKLEYCKELRKDGVECPAMK
ncbi:MAG: hypothetical protein WC471_02980 [Candidatus Woesearchaeota archaeon]